MHLPPKCTHLNILASTARHQKGKGSVGEKEARKAAHPELDTIFNFQAVRAHARTNARNET